MQSNIYVSSGHIKAKPLIRYKLTDEEGNLTQIAAWRVPADAKHPEGVRYRMAFVPRGHSRPVVLYDNHHPKGHHKHIGAQESPYLFFDARRLVLDFNRDIQLWKQARGWPQ